MFKNIIKRIKARRQLNREQHGCFGNKNNIKTHKKHKRN